MAIYPTSGNLKMREETLKQSAHKEAKVAAEVGDALQFANESEPPEMERVLSSVFVDQRP